TIGGPGNSYIMRCDTGSDKRIGKHDLHNKMRIVNAAFSFSSSSPSASSSASSSSSSSAASSASSSSVPPPPRLQEPPPVKASIFREPLKTGMLVDALDEYNKWYEAVITAIDGKCITVKYLGFVCLTETIRIRYIAPFRTMNPKRGNDVPITYHAYTLTFPSTAFSAQEMAKKRRHKTKKRQMNDVSQSGGGKRVKKKEDKGPK